MAYDLGGAQSKNGAVGNAYMNDIQDVAARVPYVTVGGNHERAAAFVHYTARWCV